MELTEARRLAKKAIAAEPRNDSTPVTLAVTAMLTELSPEVVFQVAQSLANGRQTERELAARVFRQITEAAPNRHVNEQLLQMLAKEDEPTVVAAILLALSWSREPVLLPQVLHYAHHQSALVRLAVSDAVSKLATSGQMPPILLELANDADDDVRWSAVFELGEWFLELRNHDVQVLLERISLTDTNSEVRRVATEALTQAANEVEA